MLNLPLTATLLATLLLGIDGLNVMPLVIVAVVVAYVTSARLGPAPATETAEPAQTEEPAPAGATGPPDRRPAPV
jgi:H+/Cl- antiporter ClcA